MENQSNSILKMTKESLSQDEMEQIMAGSCPSRAFNAGVVGFCLFGAYVSPVIGIGCAAYGVYSVFC